MLEILCTRMNSPSIQSDHSFHGAQFNWSCHHAGEKLFCRRNVDIFSRRSQRKTSFLLGKHSHHHFVLAFLHALSSVRVRAPVFFRRPSIRNFYSILCLLVGACFP